MNKSDHVKATCSSKPNVHEQNLLLSLWMAAIQARNEGLFYDFSRFLTNIQFSSHATSALGSASKIALDSIWDMPTVNTGSIMANTLLGAASFAFTFGQKVSQDKEFLNTVSAVSRDANAHSEIYNEADVYRFAFDTLLTRFSYFEQNCAKNMDTQQYEIQSPTLRPSFNKTPAVEEYDIFHSVLLTLKERGSNELKKRLELIESLLNKNVEAYSECDPILVKELQKLANKN